MKSLGKCLLWYTILFTLSACGTYVNKDYDEGYNFSKLKTFAWLPVDSEGVGPYKTLVGKRVKNFVTSELTQKGFENVSPSQADFLVFYHYRERGEYVPSGSRVGVGLGVGSGAYYGGGIGFGYGGGYRRSEALAIDIIDPETKQLIWRGMVNEYMQDDDPKDTRENFREVIEDILKDFPPKS